MSFGRNPFLAVAVIQAVAVLGCHGVLADDVGTAARAGKPRPRAAPRPGPPATMGVNPNAREHFDRIDLQSLTAKQARTLVNRYRDSNRPIDLVGLTTLDAAAARALADFKGHGGLRLGLTKFNAATARAFAGFKGRALILQSLATLDAAAVTVVAQYPFQVSFPSDFTRNFFAENRLTPETAAA